MPVENVPDLLWRIASATLVVFALFVFLAVLQQLARVAGRGLSRLSDALGLALHHLAWWTWTRVLKRPPDPCFEPLSAELSLHGAHALHLALAEHVRQHGVAPWRVHRWAHSPPVDLDGLNRAWLQGLRRSLAHFARARIYMVQQDHAPSGGPAAPLRRLHLDADEARLDTMDGGGDPTWWHGLTVHALRARWFWSCPQRAEDFLCRFEVDIAPYAIGQMPTHHPDAVHYDYGRVWCASTQGHGHRLTLQTRRLRSVPPARAAVARATPPGGEVVLPAGWGTAIDHGAELGGMHLSDARVLPVLHRDGCWGLVQVTNVEFDPQRRGPESPGCLLATWVTDAQYTWVRDDYLYGDLLEVQLHPSRWRARQQPSAGELGPLASPFGDRWSDVIDTQGLPVLPSGLQALRGSLDPLGHCLVTCAWHRGIAACGRRVDLWACEPTRGDGVEQHTRPDPPLRFRDVRRSVGGPHRVQDPATGLWGYVSAAPPFALTVSPRFHRAEAFELGWAPAWPADDPAHCGLIDPAGAWVLPPRWHAVSIVSDRLVIVTTDDDAWGAWASGSDPCSGAGCTWQELLPPRSRDAWAAAMRQDDPDLDLDLWLDQHKNRHGCTHAEALEAAIRRHLRHEGLLRPIQAQVRRALTEPTLGALAGVLPPGLGETALRTVGLWGLTVELTTELHSVAASFPAGTLAHIGSEYPVSLSTFDLRQEAPVTGWPVQRELPLVLGVPWAGLAVSRHPSFNPTCPGNHAARLSTRRHARPPSPPPGADS